MISVSTVPAPGLHTVLQFLIVCVSKSIRKSVCRSEVCLWFRLFFSAGTLEHVYSTVGYCTLQKNGTYRAFQQAGRRMIVVCYTVHHPHVFFSTIFILTINFIVFMPPVSTKIIGLVEWHFLLEIHLSFQLFPMLHVDDCDSPVKF